jgi:hypothetical protein
VVLCSCTSRIFRKHRTRKDVNNSVQHATYRIFVIALDGCPLDLLCASCLLHNRCFALTVFPCTPISSQFDVIAYGKLSYTPKCMSVRQIGTILRAINITMDYCLLAVPIIVLWTVQMDFRRKVELFALFSVGALACIGTVLTLVAKDHLKSDVPCTLIFQISLLRPIC